MLMMSANENFMRVYTLRRAQEKIRSIPGATKRFLILFEQLWNQSLAVYYVGASQHVCLSSLRQLFVHKCTYFRAMFISKARLVR